MEKDLLAELGGLTGMSDTEVKAEFNGVFSEINEATSLQELRNLVATLLQDTFLELKEEGLEFETK